MAAAKTDTDTSVEVSVPLKPTPENTPLPGGGSWRWSEEAAAWQANEPYSLPGAVQPQKPTEQE